MKTNNYKLFLDDIRMPDAAFIYAERIKLLDKTHTRSCEWEIVRNYNDFCEFIDKFGIPEIVSFDHDLTMEFMQHYYDVTSKTGVVEYDKLESKCGLDCIKYLCDYCERFQLKFPRYFIHSANRWGTINMRAYIKEFFKKCGHLQC
jgi:hypothetical protein